MGRCRALCFKGVHILLAGSFCSYLVLEKGVVTDGEGALWRDVEVEFFDCYSVFSSKERLSVLFHFA